MHQTAEDPSLYAHRYNANERAITKDLQLPPPRTLEETVSMHVSEAVDTLRALAERADVFVEEVVIRVRRKR